MRKMLRRLWRNEQTTKKKDSYKQQNAKKVRGYMLSGTHVGWRRDGGGCVLSGYVLAHPLICQSIHHRNQHHPRMCCTCVLCFKVLFFFSFFFYVCVCPLCCCVACFDVHVCVCMCECACRSADIVCVDGVGSSDTSTQTQTHAHTHTTSMDLFCSFACHALFLLCGCML